MKRKLYNALIKWKNDPDRKPLVLEGARQVGKTWLLKEFGKNEYQNLVYVNFHDDHEAQEIFRVNLKVDRIMYLLESITNQKITAGKTLIFMDEIQEAYRGLDSLKSFCENAREQHVVVAGSLLGTTHRKGESYPVGKVNLLTLYPMTFEEFLWAKNEERVAEMLARADWEMLQILDSKVQELLRQYYYVGGMPEAVLQYTTKGDVNKVRQIHEEILRTYDNDFAKHAGDETERIRMVWESIPNQLAKENKKFIYGAVKEGGRARDFEIAIEWLVRAGLVIRIYDVKKPEHPLKVFEDFSSFKLFFFDVGLAKCAAQVQNKQIILDSDFQFKGALTENYVLQQLHAYLENDIHYYSPAQNYEVDFLLQDEMQIIPVECKAGTNVLSASFKRYRREQKPQLAIRFSQLEYKEQDDMINVPLYLACRIFLKK